MINALLCAALVAASPAAPAQRKLSVLTTTADLAALVREVGGDRVNVGSLVTGARDPHRLEAKPSFMSRAASSDLFVQIGLELEIGYLGPILEGSRNRRIQPGGAGHVVASAGVPVLEAHGHGHGSRAEGDIHPSGNPHIWKDPFNGRIMARNITAGLNRVSPGDMNTFNARLADFERRLDTRMFGAALVAKHGGDKLWEWERLLTLRNELQKRGDLPALGGWAAKMAPHRGKNVLTYHRSWTYFVNRFGLKVLGELEPKPGIDPTPGHLAQLMRSAQAAGVKAILQEPFYSTKDAQFVGRRIGAQVLVLPGSVGHAKGVDTYFDLIDTLVNRVSGALAN